VAKIAFTGRHLCVAESKNGLFSEARIISLIDPDTRVIPWRYRAKPILGDIVESENAVFFSTKDEIISLDLKSRTELFSNELPWDDEFSHHVLSLRPEAVAVKNEWNVAIWSQEDGEYAVRLVGVQIGSQRFSAVEMLHESTGKVTQVLLSPSQMPSDLYTVGSNQMQASELNGYLSASLCLGQSFSTIVDLERMRIFHYGPGLNVDDYAYFDDTSFIRGKLWMFPLDISDSR
jgi:hypothetical protein